MILTFASSKGGVGKSTTCASLATLLAGRGEAVLILDLDQNKTLDRWAKKLDIKDLDVLAVAPEDFAAVMRENRASGAYDHILVDLAGSREATLLKAIARADLVVIPAQASEPDLREALVIASDVGDTAETAQREIPYRVLFTKLRALPTNLDRHVIAEAERAGLPRFETMLVDRIAYKEMLLNGVPPHVKEPTRGAGPELAALLSEIETLSAAAPALQHAG